MTWPFENDTSAITKKLAKKSLQSEKRRNLMVVIAVALAAFLICFTGIVSTSLTQMQRNQVVDTYEAVWLGVEENDIETLKGLPEFERVGGYYMLGEELSEQGYHASYVYNDAEMMEIGRDQMKLLEGNLPQKANEVVVSEYFLSTYGNNAKIGDTVTLDTESFHGDYVVTGIMDSVNEKEANTCAIILSKAALTEWKGFDPAGYRAYVHFKNSDQLGEELITSYCREIAEEYQLPNPSMNNKYFAYASKSFDFLPIFGVIVIVLIGGYIVIQSIFRISINDKIRSYGQLRTIGATPKQIKRIVKREGRKLGSIGILIGTVLGVCCGFLLFSKGFNAVSYAVMVSLTLISGWIMVSISIRKPVKIAAGISPIEAVRFTPVQKDIRSRKKNIKLNPVSMGIANFKRDRKKTISIVASLSIGGILLMVVSSIVLVRSPEQIARLYFPDSDYKIYLQDLSEEMLVKGNPLNEELKQEVLSVDGVTDIIVARQSLHTSIKTDANQNSGICDTLTDQNYAMVEAALTEGTMPTDSHSIVIHDQIVAYFEDMGVGSTVEFSSIDGKQSIPVTISGVFSTSKMPVIFGHGRAHTDGSVFFAPKDLFYELYPEITTFDYSWSIVSNPKKAETVKAELKNIVAEHSNLALDEIDTAIAAEKSQNSAAFGSMQVLSWLVFLFGVINLINTTLSNQMSRKQENSVLRSIGLTQKQLCKMNICEGLCYAFFATLAILIVGFPISIVASREISIATFGGNVVPYKFPVLEMGLFILVLFGMELILSVWTIRRQKKQSLIEQMRAME
ncbi:FtsX-like permease family protein [Klebsiella pneumoniae]|jgi:putative ABC transport system permease protein|uniref:ABC-type transport system, involved in lipoprotein release, permease component n=4 Tax=Clostridia TaxID=186801 RepID=D4K997_9FIRM|nr:MULTISPECIES: FtsX-like permease family protein [Clostridia]MCG4511911.1 FtsX-like permease family protein [Klebsiella pneumoniae]SFE86932.1 putative ABC transport system permease protein [Lactobacillus rogosae]EDM51657.1 efflux ABC transporter, permease protein [Eubacterium ventriosum ATCC 27560]MBC5720179.1 FtsX-like permease family protein [Faecalibacterium duncaniae]MCB5691102.1 FtsX-like permease family protein [Fusicatenibacter saccharivorans]